MKLRIIKLTAEQLTAILQGKSSTFASTLPSDLELLDTKMDLSTKLVTLVVRSDSFEDVAESLPIPELTLSAKVVTKPASTLALKPAATVLRVEPKPAISLAVAKPTQPPANRYAAKMENEFSPEERKLLNFTVKGNSVIVKPVTFLKAEWDDINETVRSLGGKWVKGDIISYWEIPLQ
jgi:hypothetical protein